MREKLPTRRQFARKVAALAAAPVAASVSTAAAQEQAQPARMATVGQALAEIIRLRHGQHLDADQLCRVAQRIDNNQRMADRLKRIPLQNGEEPAFQFTPDVP